MNAFETELMRRSPLAGCVLELGEHVFDGPFDFAQGEVLARIYDAHRGRCTRTR